MRTDRFGCLQVLKITCGYGTILGCSLDPGWKPQGFPPSMSQRFVSALGLGSKRAETATVIFLCAVKNHGEPSLFKDLHWRGGGQWVIGSAAGVQCSTSESQLENSVCDFSDLTVLEAACGRVASRNFLFELIMKKGTESPSATLSSEVVSPFYRRNMERQRSVCIWKGRLVCKILKPEDGSMFADSKAVCPSPIWAAQDQSAGEDPSGRQNSAMLTRFHVQLAHAHKHTLWDFSHTLKTSVGFHILCTI